MTNVKQQESWRLSPGYSRLSSGCLMFKSTRHLGGLGALGKSASFCFHGLMTLINHLISPGPNFPYLENRELSSCET